MRIKTWSIISLLLLTGICSDAQNYQALHGSSHAGSLGAIVNPASIVNVPYAWDITPLAVQAKHSTNAFIIKNSSFFSPTSGATVAINNGESAKFLMSNQDLRILNARFRINNYAAFAFGASVRSYQSLKTSSMNWQDTILNVKEFIEPNINNSPLDAAIRGNAWAEFYGTYARTIIDNGKTLLNAGITIKVNKGLAGAFGSATGINYGPVNQNNQNSYLLTNGQLSYGYSSNLDILDSTGFNAGKRKQFLQKSLTTFSINLGVEYTTPSALSDDPYAYDLKIGVSLLDLGYNNFQYSNNSLNAILNKGNVSDSIIQTSFDNINSVDDIKDSLGNISGSVTALLGNFKIFQPARIVLNVDKEISENIFVNAELTLPLTPLLGNKNLFTPDMNLVAVTPRFETKAFGLYLPATINTKAKLWIGGAIKAGPLLVGVHNWANIFSKNKMQNGGGYLALTFRPWKKRENENIDRERTKREKRSRQEKKQLGCPVVRM